MSGEDSLARAVEEVVAALAAHRLRVVSALVAVSDPEVLRVRVEFDSGPDGRLDLATLTRREGRSAPEWVARVLSRHRVPRRSAHGTLRGAVATVGSAVRREPRSEYVPNEEWAPLHEVTRRPEVRALGEVGALPDEVLRVASGDLEVEDLAVAAPFLAALADGAPTEWVRRRHPGTTSELGRLARSLGAEW